MTRVVALAAVAMLVEACGGAAVTVPPTWERPGLGGAVRPEMGSPQPGEAAPELALPDLDGRVVSLSSLRGRWLVVHFTATWCPFCDREVEYLGALADALAPRGVKTVIVDVEENADVWHEYASKHVAPSVLALHDASGAGAAPFAPPRAQPSFDDRAQAVLDATLVVDPAGVIRLFLLPDSAHFNPTFRAVRAELERLVPQPVVGVGAAPLTVAAGDHAELDVRLDIAPGYHVMSDRPSEPTYVADPRGARRCARRRRGRGAVPGAGHLRARRSHDRHLRRRRGCGRARRRRTGRRARTQASSRERPLPGMHGVALPVPRVEGVRGDGGGRRAVTSSGGVPRRPRPGKLTTEAVGLCEGGLLVSRAGSS